MVYILDEGSIEFLDDTRDKYEDEDVDSLLNKRFISPSSNTTDEEQQQQQQQEEEPYLVDSLEFIERFDNNNNN